jgi:hypothetical protein
VYTFFKFILFGSIGAFIFLFVISGAIGYFFYANSNGNVQPDTVPLLIPDWDSISTVPREVLIGSALALAAVWVLIGSTASENSGEEDLKQDHKKGRSRKRYYDED